MNEKVRNEIALLNKQIRDKQNIINALYKKIRNGADRFLKYADLSQEDEDLFKVIFSDFLFERSMEERRAEVKLQQAIFKMAQRD